MKNTKKALLLSVMSLVLCVSMLVGTTFAWFTDSVSTGKNIIAAGNLDIELEYSKDFSNWASVEGQSDLVDPNAKWEPGHTEVVYLRISNKGSLALKYIFRMTVTDLVVGKSVEGNEIHLADYLKYDIVDATAKYADRAAARKAVESTAQILADYAVNGTMTTQNESKTLALVVYMPEEVGNEANHLTNTEAPSVELGLKLDATQLTHELDSFGSDYDAGAAWTGGTSIDWYLDDPNAATFTIDTAEELAGFAALVNGTATAPVTTFAAEAATLHDDFQGHTVKLGANVDLNDIAWTPIGRIGTSSTDFTYSFRGTFDGGNFTVSNLNVSNTGWAGLFGIAYKADINNVKLAGVTINSNRMAGSVVGQLYGSINNCHVTKANITVIPNAVGDSYDNGDKVGGIVGWIGDNGNNRTLTGCTVTDAQIGAYRDVGGIAGYAATTTTISGNTVTGDTDITADQTTNFYGEKDPNAGAIFGRGSNVTAENNTVGEQVKLLSTYSKDGLTLKSGTDFEGVTLYQVPVGYANTTVKVPEGVTTIGGYAFADNKNIQKIVLPSSVTKLNDRAFRDTSASEVVLNEGLQNISYQAFRNALNVKAVTIPSTVTTISKEAFQYSGVQTLTIPATVTTIEYGAMRDMKELVSVTVDSDADIPVYAFRACAKLQTVILNSENVTFGGGSRGMIFTNKENGDGTAITVVVKNEAVKARLLAADTAAKDYGGYTIAVGTPASDAAALTSALADPNVKYIVLTADVNAEAATTAPYGNKYAFKQDGGVLDGNGNELYMECYGDHYGIMTSGGTIKNVTIREGCRAVMIMYPTEDIIIDNVNIGGDGVLYPINTGEAGSDGVDLVVTNSVLAGWTSYGNIESASFTNVAFEQGTYYDNIYGRVLKPYVGTTMTDCSFIAHMNLDLSNLAQGQKIVMKNCTVDGQALTAAVMVVPTADSQYDTELFTVDLPSWASSIADCIVFE